MHRFRIRLRAFTSTLALALCACGASTETPAAKKTVPVLEVAAATGEPPPDPGPDPEQPPPSPDKPEPLSRCIADLRDGRGLPTSARDTAAADMYASSRRAESAEDFNTARKGYLELVKTAPQSAYVPLAYLAFGELFFREAEVDPAKLDFARQAYHQVLEYPPPDNTAAPHAMYQLAQVERRTGKLTDALSWAKKAVDVVMQFPALPCAAAIAEGARADLVAIYAQVGRPEMAGPFFQRSSGDAPGEQVRTLAMVFELAELYVQMSRSDDAVKAVTSITRTGLDAALCAREKVLIDRLDGATARAREAISRAHASSCATR